uniref:BTB domain-containing protein n=1 Tax=Panagrellus redivivus TaxID=6233 RepID=A0A7E4UVX1_PANRE
MSTTKPTITFKDSTTLTLTKADLTGKKVGDRILTPKRNVPYSDGLQWWIRWYPAGKTKDAKDYVSVVMWVNKSVKTNLTVAVDGSSINETTKCSFQGPSKSYGWPKYASHEQLHPLFRDGKLTITCNVEFDIVPPIFSIPRNFQMFESVPMDVDFVIGSERVPAHKSFLALISPVLQAMFKHNSAELKSGEIKITEFDFETVKTAIDICYGREFETLSVETIVGILRFCDKYFITPVVKELERQPLLHPSVDNFFTVINYAYDCNKDALMAECYNFFKINQNEIKAKEKFAELPLTLVITVLKSAFDLKTDYDVLCHAHNNGIDFVVSHLEESLIKPINLDNFCAVVTYAWNCSRKDLQHMCAKFLNEHRDEVMDLEVIHNLPSDVFASVLKASYALKRRQEIVKLASASFVI